MQEALHFNRASGPDQKPMADHQHKPDLKHLEEPDVEPDWGPDELQREHTPELSTAERTRSPRRSEEGSAQGQEQQPLTIKFEGKGQSKSKTDKDAYYDRVPGLPAPGTPFRYHEQDKGQSNGKNKDKDAYYDMIPGPPAPGTPFVFPDQVRTPEWMCQGPVW